MEFNHQKPNPLMQKGAITLKNTLVLFLKRENEGKPGRGETWKTVPGLSNIIGEK